MEIPPYRDCRDLVDLIRFILWEIYLITHCSVARHFAPALVVPLPVFIISTSSPSLADRRCFCPRRRRRRLHWPTTVASALVISLPVFIISTSSPSLADHRQPRQQHFLSPHFSLADFAPLRANNASKSCGHGVNKNVWSRRSLTLTLTPVLMSQPTAFQDPLLSPRKWFCYVVLIETPHLLSTQAQSACSRAPCLSSVANMNNNPRPHTYKINHSSHRVVRRARTAHPFFPLSSSFLGNTALA